MSSPLFDEREKAVIRWGELVSKNEARHDRTTFETLSKYFDATEIVELTTVAAFRGLMNRFMDSLQIELEPPALLARGGKAVASPEHLHAYLQKIVDGV